MPARHRSRQRALQVLFLWDQRKQPIDEAISSYYATLSSEEDQPLPADPDEFMEALVRGASEQAPDIDRRIVEKSENWRLERMPAVDRNILRLAVYEMTDLEHARAGGHRRSAWSWRASSPATNRFRSSTACWTPCIATQPQ